MRSRRRLRSRIIISFALFGLGLTALFAAATIYLRVRMEDQLINDTLTRELRHFVDFKREYPEPDARWSMSLFEAQIVRAGRTATVPFAWQAFDSGVYDIDDLDDSGQSRSYKLAVYKDKDFWAYLRFDQSSQKLTERQLLIVLEQLIKRWQTGQDDTGLQFSMIKFNEFFRFSFACCNQQLRMQNFWQQGINNLIFFVYLQLKEIEE